MIRAQNGIRLRRPPGAPRLMPLEIEALEIDALAIEALEIKAPSRHFAGVIAGQASLANVGPQDIDRARRRDADLPNKGGAAISAASHASVFVIDIGAGDSIKIGVIFQRETWPLTRKRAARTAGPARRGGDLAALHR